MQQQIILHDTIRDISAENDEMSSSVLSSVQPAFGELLALEENSRKSGFSRRLLSMVSGYHNSAPLSQHRHLGLFAHYALLSLHPYALPGSGHGPYMWTPENGELLDHASTMSSRVSSPSRPPRAHRRMPHCRTPRCTSIRTPAHRTPCCTSICTRMPAHSRMHDFRRMQRDPNHRCMQCDPNLASMTTETPTQRVRLSLLGRDPHGGGL